MARGQNGTTLAPRAAPARDAAPTLSAELRPRQRPAPSKLRYGYPRTQCGTARGHLRVNPPPCISVYTSRMEPVVTTQWAPNAVEQTREIEDFDAVMRLYWPRVFRYALASLRDRDAAESLAQDCFLKAYRARERFRGEASLGTWLMQIAVNLVRDSMRSRRLRFWNRTRAAAPDFDLVSQSLVDRGSSPEDAAAAKERVAAIWSVVETLSERQRTVFLLRFVEDLDLLEIAAVTGLREGTVKVHLFRALETVRKRMGEIQ